jgi:hypothetical protein
MALPPKGDPRRPLHLAARSMRVLGLLLLIVASCVGFSLSRMRGIGAASGLVWIKLIMIGVFALYAAPGVCYFIFPIYMMRRKLWAVIASIVLVSVHLLFALLGFSGIIFSTLMTPNQQTPVTLIPLVVIFLVIAALGQLLWHLSKSFEAIKYMPAEEHGFEPILPAQLYVAPQVGQQPIAPSGDRHDYTPPPGT